MKALNSTITRNPFVHLISSMVIWVGDSRFEYQIFTAPINGCILCEKINGLFKCRHLMLIWTLNIVTSNEEKSWGKLSKNWKQFLILLCWYFLLNIWLLLFIDKNSFHKRRLDVAGQTNSGMKNEGKITWLEPGYFLLQLSNCMMETCMLLAGVRVHEHWWPQ